MSFTPHHEQENSRQQPAHILEQQSWPPAPLSILQKVNRTSNQVFEKKDDGSIAGLRYEVLAEPATLKPTKSWIIRVEQWVCKDTAAIMANDILSLHILNKDLPNQTDYSAIVKDIIVRNAKISANNQGAFNAVMVAVLLISKIDAGRIPDIDKTLSIYQLQT